jgi:hypothetical protein
MTGTIRNRNNTYNANSAGVGVGTAGAGAGAGSEITNSARKLVSNRAASNGYGSSTSANGTSPELISSARSVVSRNSSKQQGYSSSRRANVNADSSDDEDGPVVNLATERARLRALEQVQQPRGMPSARLKQGGANVMSSLAGPSGYADYGL